METQTQMHRMGLNPLLTFYIDVDANANGKCEHTLTILFVLAKLSTVSSKYHVGVQKILPLFYSCS